MTERVEREVVAELGVQPQRASVTFLGVEPIDVLRFVVGDDLVHVTVGCARHPMTDPDDLAPDPLRGPRAELVVRMHADTPLPGLHTAMATLAAAPAVEGLVLVPDALVDLGEPLWSGSSCTAVLLTEDELPDVALDEPREPVRFVRAVPITANEAAWVRLRGADALRDVWGQAGIDVRSARRTSANVGGGAAN
ncbi:suppressor of fused domain protein [Gordonia sinesedis]